METKKSKYDTNPLDPDVERKAEEAWGEGDSGGSTQQMGGGSTRPVGTSPPAPDNARQNVYSEAPTRRYDNNAPLEAPYPSVFIPPTYAPPAQYQQQQQPNHAYQQVPTRTPASRRHIPGLGISENWALLLAYAPYVGIVVSLLELFLVPRQELRVRFHASQALSLHIAILVIGTIFHAIATVGGGDLGRVLFNVLSTVFLVISMARVWKGEPHRIAPLAEPAQWFNEHIEPRKQG